MVITTDHVDVLRRQIDIITEWQSEGRPASGELIAAALGTIADALEMLTTKPHPRTLADIRATGYLDGTTEVAASADDRRIGREATCDACGRLGLRPRLFRGAGIYAGYMVCPGCGHADEF